MIPLLYYLLFPSGRAMRHTGKRIDTHQSCFIHVDLKYMSYRHGIVLFTKYFFHQETLTFLFTTKQGYQGPLEPSKTPKIESQTNEVITCSVSRLKYVDLAFASTNLSKCAQFNFFQIVVGSIALSFFHLVSSTIIISTWVI